MDADSLSLYQATTRYAAAARALRAARCSGRCGANGTDAFRNARLAGDAESATDGAPGADSAGAFWLLDRACVSGAVGAGTCGFLFDSAGAGIPFQSRYGRPACSATATI